MWRVGSWRSRKGDEIRPASFMKLKTDWSELQRKSSEKAHAAEVAALRLQLDHATQQIERMEKTKRAKIIAAVAEQPDVEKVVVKDPIVAIEVPSAKVVAE